MKKSIKYFLIGTCSFLLLSSIATAVAVPLSLKSNNINSSNSSNNYNSILIKKAINQEVKTINDNSTKSSFVLEQNTALTIKNIKNQIIDKIKKSIPKITTNEIKQIENNLKVELSKTNSNGLVYNGTISYDGTNYPIIIQGSKEVNTNLNLISFKQKNYILNLQSNQTWSTFNILPTINNWQNGDVLQYSITFPNNEQPFIVSTTTSNTQPFSFTSKIQKLILNSTPFKNSNFYTVTLTATINGTDTSASASTKITINNNPLFLYATPDYNQSIQSVNLDCWVNESYSISFKQYKTLSQIGLTYYLVEEVNEAGNIGASLVSKQMVNAPASNDLKNDIDSIQKIAKCGIVTYYLEIKDGKNTVMTSNPITINCNHKGGVTITNPNYDSETSSINVNLAKTSKCILTLHNNVPGISYSWSDIYYQVAANNNEWEPITNASNLFKVDLVGNELIFSNLASEIGINIKLENQLTHLYSNIVTINTIAPNSMWNNFKNNGISKTINPSSSYNQISVNKGDTLNLSFIPPKINVSNVEYNWSILKTTGFTSIGTGEKTFSKEFEQSGIYIIRMQVSWPNNINVSALTYFFKVTVNENNQTLINNSTAQINKLISTQTNVLNILQNYFEECPASLLPFINNWGYGYQIASNVSASDFNNYFSIKSCSFNSQISGLLQVTLNVLNTIDLNDYSDGSDDTTIAKGATLIVTTPLQFSDFNKAGYTSSIGESEININILNKVNSMSSNTQSEIGWELINSSDKSFNNKFISLNLTVVNNSAYSFTITPWNSNNTLPNYCNISKPITHSMFWNMQSSSQIRIDYTWSGAASIVFDPFFFPNPSSVTYNWYKVSGDQATNTNITGTWVASTGWSSYYDINSQSVKSIETFTYYCICTYVINNKTYTSRSQNIVVAFTNGSTIATFSK